MVKNLARGDELGARNVSEVIRRLVSHVDNYRLVVFHQLEHLISRDATRAIGIDSVRTRRRTRLRLAAGCVIDSVARRENHSRYRNQSEIKNRTHEGTSAASLSVTPHGINSTARGVV